jgi:hypothetical protein
LPDEHRHATQCLEVPLDLEPVKHLSVKHRLDQSW